MQGRGLSRGLADPTAAYRVRSPEGRSGAACGALPPGRVFNCTWTVETSGNTPQRTLTVLPACLLPWQAERTVATEARVAPNSGPLRGTCKVAQGSSGLGRAGSFLPKQIQATFVTLFSHPGRSGKAQLGGTTGLATLPSKLPVPGPLPLSLSSGKLECSLLQQLRVAPFSPEHWGPRGGRKGGKEDPEGPRP